MAKAAKKKPAKKRAEHNEEKVKFDGTFEQMIAISMTGVGAKKEEVASSAEESTFTFMGNDFDFEYSSAPDRINKKLVCYFASFEDNETEFFLENELIFKVNSLDKEFIFPYTHQQDMALRFAIAEAIILNESLK